MGICKWASAENVNVRCNCPLESTHRPCGQKLLSQLINSLSHGLYQTWLDRYRNGVITGVQMEATYESNSMNSHNLSPAFSEGSISQKARPILKHQYGTFTWEDKSSIWWQVDSIRFLHPGNGNKSFPQELTLILGFCFVLFFRFCTHKAPADTTMQRLTKCLIQRHEVSPDTASS